jgi:hypothetical protein
MFPLDIPPKFPDASAQRATPPDPLGFTPEEAANLDEAPGPGTLELEAADALATLSSTRQP